jgi:phenylalanyl-tRNA synthetase alpha chain
MLTAEQISLLEAQIESLTDLTALKALRDEYFGAQGALKNALQALKVMDADLRRQEGPKLQEQKTRIENLFTQAEARLLEQGEQEKLSKKAENLGIGVPKIGHLHPITETILAMNEFFGRMGYSVYDGPEIETDEFNFQRLNVPKDHPAREMQDTIYIDPPNILLRTQTSSIEARALASLKPPFRIVCPGKSYRNEKPNKTNHFIFHQYQAVVVQEKVTLADLFGTLEMLFKFMYGDKTVVRFRSKYYPEVEPGVGPDMRCFSCEGKGCGVCKNVGWMEMGGAGIIHKKVLRMAGIDSDRYMGFAFGLGLDRWVMAKYNITDIRTLLGGNVAYPYSEHESTL